MEDPIDPEEVQIFLSPWLMQPGMRVTKYFGPVSVGLEGEPSEQLVRGLLFEMQRKAAAMGANSVVGFEMTADPFHENGVRLEAKATATFLESYPN